MSPRPADPETRTALIEAAARMLSAREALSARRLAAVAGTSTQAVYTYFGSMDELRRALRDEGFARLRDYMAATDATADPVADICVLGWAYCSNGLTNPDLYRIMFQELPLDASDAATGLDTFASLLATVRRAIDDSRFDDIEPWGVAVQLWAMMHGLLSLVLADTLSFADLIEHMPAMARSLFVGFGDDPGRASTSIQAAVARMEMPVETPTR